MKVQKSWRNKKGIYKISFRDKCYVGSSIDLYNRIIQHLHQLRYDKHHSKYMQRCFNKYGEDEFTLEILEIFEGTEKELRELELKYINNNNSKFNSTTPIEYRHSSEMKKKISDTLKKKYKEGLIIPPKLGKGNKVSIYDYRGELLHSDMLISKATTFLNLSNRSVLNNHMRKKTPMCKQQYIIIPEGETYDFLYDWINLNKGKRIPIYKINQEGEIKKCKHDLYRLFPSIMNSEDFLYFSKQNKCYYTFIGNLFKCRYYKKL